MNLKSQDQGSDSGKSIHTYVELRFCKHNWVVHNNNGYELSAHVVCKETLPLTSNVNIRKFIKLTLQASVIKWLVRVLGAIIR